MTGAAGRDQAFLWAVGIEDTAIGRPVGGSGRILDEYELTGHYGRWKQDLAAAAALGCTALRYGLPWYRVNPARGRFDWSFSDEVLTFAAQECGLTVILDLVHYGTPTWLPDAFCDPGYPAAVAAWAGAVASRYGDLVTHYTPLNEPLITASFCGQRGVWPPYGHGDEGWLQVALGCVEGMQAATRAIRTAAPQAKVVHVEATHVFGTEDPRLRGEVELLTGRSLLPTDLYTGRVGPDHPLAGWLSRHGATAERLAAIRAGAEEPDLIGVNYYPDLSCRRLVRRGGSTVAVAVPGGAAGLTAVTRQYHERYGRPVLVAETGVDGTAEQHTAWLHASLDAVAELRAGGVPVRGYTWWPLFDFIDWSWASGGRVVEEFSTVTVAADGTETIGPVLPPTGDRPADFRRPMGLFHLADRPDGLVPVWTSACDTYLDRTRHGPDLVLGARTDARPGTAPTSDRT